MTTACADRRLPAFVSLALQPLPTSPLEFALQRLADGIIVRHPRLLERLGSHGARRFGIEPLDLPFAIVIEVVDGAARLTVVRKLEPVRVDARIVGTLLSLVELVDGRHDGDALFFSRDIMVEGDMEAVVALRNAIDDAELDLAREAAALTGPFAAIAEHGIRGAARALAGISSLPRPHGERAR